MDYLKEAEKFNETYEVNTLSDKDMVIRFAHYLSNRLEELKEKIEELPLEKGKSTLKQAFLNQAEMANKVNEIIRKINPP